MTTSACACVVAMSGIAVLPSVSVRVPACCPVAVPWREGLAARASLPGVRWPTLRVRSPPRSSVAPSAESRTRDR